MERSRNPKLDFVQKYTGGLCGKLYNAKPVGGASCPAMMVLETATDFFAGQPSGLLAKYLTHVETKFFLENLVSSLNPSDLKITI